MTTASQTDVDLVVAGGGPAGLATAIDAALAGLSVTVVEPRATPIDKACGEGLMPGAVRALRELGVVVEGRPFRGIRYVDGSAVAEARFSRGAGLGVRRTVLQEAMARRAADVGVRFEHGRVTDVRQQVGQVEVIATTGTRSGTTTLRAPYLVAADGLHSTVRELLGIEATSRGSRPARYGIRRHVAVAPWADVVEVHWARDCEVYVTPIADDSVGVAVLGPRGLDLDAALRSLPDLRDRLDGAPSVGTDRGAGPLRQDTGTRVAGRVLLVGDAAGYVDALTGEGIRLAALEARAAVGCVRRGTPEAYDAEWRTITASYRRGTRALLAVAAHERLRSRIVPAAARFPGLFARCVDLVGCESG